jgi:hypothetical protein
MDALDHLRDDGVDFVFNTPNASSRPGYLRMGWHDLGPLAVSVRPTRVTSIPRLLRARVPADRWSQATSAGEPATAVLADDGVAALLRALEPPARLRTRRSVEFLRWRYGFEPLRYRAITLGRDPAEGIAIFRTRRRGDASELAVCDVLVPSGDARARRALERRLVKSAAGDYAIQLDDALVRSSGFVRLPGQGPRLAWRDVQPAGDEAPPTRQAFELVLGDIELF